MEEELDRQVRAYVATGVAALLGLDEDALRGRVAPLRRALLAQPTTDDDDAAAAAAAARDADARGDHVPVVLVPDLPAAVLNAVVPALRHGGRRGLSVVPDDELVTYRPVEGVVGSEGDHLLLGVDTGGPFHGTPPEAALAAVRAAGRTPLTVAEGLALVVVRPDVLRPNRCFSLMGSRRGDQRVPAVWLSAGRPKLGWCWDRNPHDWLGAAHAARRLQVADRDA
ncbi:MAG: hypothetical protein H5T83_08080 [Actinotalea sp.]|nr:hypothetical protein [Actinotalea sp.]